MKMKVSLTVEGNTSDYFVTKEGELQAVVSDGNRVLTPDIIRDKAGELLQQTLKQFFEDSWG